MIFQCSLFQSWSNKHWSLFHQSSGNTRMRSFFFETGNVVHTVYGHLVVVQVNAAQSTAQPRLNFSFDFCLLRVGQLTWHRSIYIWPKWAHCTGGLKTQRGNMMHKMATGPGTWHQADWSMNEWAWSWRPCMTCVLWCSMTVNELCLNWRPLHRNNDNVTNCCNLGRDKYRLFLGLARCWNMFIMQTDPAGDFKACYRSFKAHKMIC